jgi:hypothetical protein
MNDAMSEFHYRNIKQPHTIVECANGEVCITLYQIKEMKLEAHIIEDNSCLTISMKDGACILFFGKPKELHELAERFANQVITFSSFQAPTVKYATMGAPIVTITNEEERHERDG